jgi:hypothetical protein
MGFVPVWLGIVSVLIMILVVYLVVRYTSPIYKTAILSYDDAKIFKRFSIYMKKTFRKK